MPNREQGDWWQKSLTLVSGCSWPPGERPEECRHCYAGPMCERFAAIHGGNAKDGSVILRPRFSTIRTHPERLAWLKPTGAAKTWLCSIAGDLFHPDVPDGFIRDVLNHILGVDLERRDMEREPHHTAILTKRYERAVERVCEWYDGHPVHFASMAKAFILMPSAGTQDSVDRACRAMARLPEGVRWGLHCEPMLEELDLCAAFDITSITHTTPPGRKIAGPGGLLPAATERPRPSWIVVGGETNVRNRSKARPCHPDWVRGLRDQCAAAGVPFWFKSWGEWAPARPGAPCPPCSIVAADGSTYKSRHDVREARTPKPMECVGKARAGRVLGGRTHDAMPGGWEVNG